MSTQQIEHAKIVFQTHYDHLNATLRRGSANAEVNRGTDLEHVWSNHVTDMSIAISIVEILAREVGIELDQSPSKTAQS